MLTELVFILEKSNFITIVVLSNVIQKAFVQLIVKPPHKKRIVKKDNAELQGVQLRREAEFRIDGPYFESGVLSECAYVLREGWRVFP